MLVQCLESIIKTTKGSYANCKIMASVIYFIKLERSFHNLIEIARKIQIESKSNDGTDEFYI